MTELDMGAWRDKQARFEGKYLSRVQLKSVKHAPYLSEETNAFTATVYWDGKRLATARNDGQGGSTFLHPYSPKENERLREVEKMLSGDPDHGFDGLGGLCDSALEKHLKEKADRRAIRGGKVAWVDANSPHKIYSVPWPEVARDWPATKQRFVAEAVKMEWIANPSDVTFINDTIDGG